ncbi:hypothetical protein ACIBL6_14930 [Streptomyces sp. NPDC050400]|uniref:hypothetical protein n=1 Tax=Streptomyces sp. NPDC050400 TaxID=3365610 RepID=UPI00378FBDE9
MRALPRRPRSRGRRRLAVTATATALGLMAALVTADQAAADRSPAAVEPAHQDSSCFWVGPYTHAEDRFNIAYLDTNAAYWTSRYTIPAGARLTFKGRYPHARYQSLNTYDAVAATPSAALNDTRIQPDPGSTNPFLPGAPRTLPHRDWTVHVSTDRAPDDPSQQAPNTLYGSRNDPAKQVLFYRVYVPDKGRDATGGVGLPTPELTLADGTVLTGRALCDSLHVPTTPVAPKLRSLSDYLSDRDQPGKPLGFPARDPLLWRASYNASWNLQCTYYDNCPPNPVRAPGQYSNLDNAYLNGFANRALGPVLVLRGRMPTTPRTHHRAPFMRPSQLRYWSLCAYEAHTTRVEGDDSCIDDEQVPADADGDYTLVVSLPRDRPSNASIACGVGWIAWPEKGDGAGHPDDALLLLRNMMPAQHFTHAVQNTEMPGDEASVMGPYLPTGTYTTPDAFEADGCSGPHGH